MQLLIIKELDQEENLWLQSLRKDIKDKQEIEFLLKTYEEKKHSKLYQAAMQMIKNAYESIKDKNTISQILKVPVEVVEKVLGE